jgi:hypothetical protein
MTLPVDPQKNSDFQTPAAQGILASAKSAPYSKGRDLWVQMAENGKILTTTQAALAKCAECCAFYVDGKSDCGIWRCSLYRKMPYGKYRKIRIQGSGEVPKQFKKQEPTT